MEQVYHTLVYSVWLGVIRNDRDVMARLRQSSSPNLFLDEKGDLLFTLPEMFDFLVRHYPHLWPGQGGPTRRDYHALRRALYQNPTNTLLRQAGAGVTLEQAHERHDLTVYRLGRYQAE